MNFSLKQKILISWILSAVGNYLFCSLINHIFIFKGNISNFAYNFKHESCCMIIYRVQLLPGVCNHCIILKKVMTNPKNLILIGLTGMKVILCKMKTGWPTDLDLELVRLSDGLLLQWKLSSFKFFSSERLRSKLCDHFNFS